MTFFWLKLLFTLTWSTTFIAAGNLPEIQISIQDIEENTSAYVTHTSTEFPEYAIRIKEQNDQLCDARSKQYTGWIDIPGGKHLFFWYFESLSKPSTDPLMLWMTGGPGCSGMIGMLMELGPCLVNDHGNGTDNNPYGWTKNSSMIFVDQPAGTGFSYTDPGVEVPSDSFVGATDMYFFLQLFMTEVFPQTRKLPFHISGESYGGHYIPTLGAEITRQNILHPTRPKINLRSLLIGNGLVSPLDTTFGYYETLCTTKPGVTKPVFNQTRCELISEALPRCVYVHEACYRYPDERLCKAADTVCSGEIRALFDSEAAVAGGRDPFDITRTCEVDQLCYKSALLLEDYINTPAVWAAFDVPSHIHNFSVQSDEVVAAFYGGNDLYVNTMPEIKYALENGIDVLIYNGNLDLACNSAGNFRWTNALTWNGQADFTSQDMRPWYSVIDGIEIEAGKFRDVRAYGVKGAHKRSRFAFVTINNSGHMVPLDQPQVALDLVNRWLFGEGF